MRQTFIELLSIFLEALYLLLETFFYIVIQFSILVFSCIRTAGLILRANVDVIIACIVAYIMYLSRTSFRRAYKMMTGDIIDEEREQFGIKK